MKRYEKNVCKWFGVIFLVLAIFLIPAAFYENWRANATEKWPTTKGIITHSSIEESKVRVKYRGQKTSYQAIVNYSYRVDDTEYGGDKIAMHPVDRSINPSLAKKIVKKYRPGKSVTVFYDPRNPEESVLEVGVTKDSDFFFVLGFGCLVVGGLLSLTWFVKPKDTW